MPFSTRRSSTRGTPRGLLGRSGSITRHSKSVRSYRLMHMLNQISRDPPIPLMSSRPSSTLAELLMPLPAANPFSTMRASLRWYSSEELEDGVTYGGQSWLRRGGRASFFFPRCCCETAMLQEGVSDHRHERMTVKALPRSALKMIKTEFFFHLLVSLLAYPSRLDGGC